MASTTVYCLASDITARLSEAGKLGVVDDDNDGTLSETEEGYITEAIAIASNVIDEALVLTFPEVPISQDEASLNRTMRRWAADLATEWLCQRKGQAAPKGIKERADLVRAQLDEHVKGDRRIPGLTYPGDGYTEELRRFGRPRVVNPRGR